MVGLVRTGGGVQIDEVKHEVFVLYSSFGFQFVRTIVSRLELWYLPSEGVHSCISFPIHGFSQKGIRSNPRTPIPGAATLESAGSRGGFCGGD